MNRRIFGWDLPPGCSLSDIPGNRPEDDAWEALIDGFYKTLNKEENTLASTCEDIVIKAIEYGMEAQREEKKRIAEENKYYEQMADEWHRDKDML